MRNYVFPPPTTLHKFPFCHESCAHGGAGAWRRCRCTQCTAAVTTAAMHLAVAFKAVSGHWHIGQLRWRVLWRPAFSSLQQREGEHRLPAVIEGAASLPMCSNHHGRPIEQLEACCCTVCAGAKHAAGRSSSLRKHRCSHASVCRSTSLPLQLHLPPSHLSLAPSHSFLSFLCTHGGHGSAF